MPLFTLLIFFFVLAPASLAAELPGLPGAANDWLQFRFSKIARPRDLPLESKLLALSELVTMQLSVGS